MMIEWNIQEAKELGTHTQEVEVPKPQSSKQERNGKRKNSASSSNSM
jgi:hypothetical protein